MSSAQTGQPQFHATGTFDVKVTPQKPETLTDPSLGRMTFDKQFHGALDATSRGEMLSSGGPERSGAYVALEKVTGTLDGRRGSFVLQHTGIMDRGTPHLTITVVPESGTDQLQGLSGSMEIKVEGGKHFYTFTYSLTQPAK